MKYITCFCVYEKEDKRVVDLALITAKQVFELFILILSGVVIGKIKMVNEEGKGMLSNLLIYFVVPFMIINSYMSGYNAEILKNMSRMLLQHTYYMHRNGFIDWHNIFDEKGSARHYKICNYIF